MALRCSCATQAAYQNEISGSERKVEREPSGWDMAYDTVVVANGREPRLARWAAQRMPPGPPPTTATTFPSRTPGNSEIAELSAEKQFTQRRTAVFSSRCGTLANAVNRVSAKACGTGRATCLAHRKKNKTPV